MDKRIPKELSDKYLLANIIARQANDITDAEIAELNKKNHKAWLEEMEPLSDIRDSLGISLRAMEFCLMNDADDLESMEKGWYIRNRESVLRAYKSVLGAQFAHLGDALVCAGILDGQAARKIKFNY